MSMYQSLLLLWLTWVAIVDGHEAPAGKYPYHVIIRSGGEHICSGSIINERYILTVRSCVIGYSGRDLIIVAGTNSLDKHGSSYRIRKIIHPDDTKGDIALLRTAHNIRFTYNVRPIKIASYDHDYAGYQMIITAFKKPPTGRPFTDKLQEYHYETQNGYKCMGRYIGASDKFICLIKSDGERVCNADFGGAIVANYRIIGIKIPGEKCVGTKPEVHLRIEHYSHWIHTNSDLRINDDWYYDPYGDYDSIEFPLQR